jgi:hypothetical protein
MADLSSTRNLVRRHARTAMAKASVQVVSDTRAVSPVDTGKMRGRTTASPVRESGSTVEFDLTADTPYARFVAEGTRAHVIRPRARKALRFQMGGRTVFARRVNHPGTRPNAEWWSEPALTARFRKAIERALRSTVTEG